MSLRDAVANVIREYQGQPKNVRAEFQRKWQSMYPDLKWWRDI